MRYERLKVLVSLGMLVLPAAGWEEPPRQSDPRQGSILGALSGDDAPQAQQLVKRIDAAVSADRWPDAIAAAEELRARMEQALGADHFDVVSATWRVRTFRLVADLSGEERAEFAAAGDHTRQARSLNRQGKYAAAQALFDKALETNRRLLGEDNPDTARSYNYLAYSLNAQGKYRAAEPLFEKALGIYRRLLSDDHPDTASSYNNVAYNLWSQGKNAAAQPLFEKALEIRRRLWTDDHPDTAQSYNNLASNLDALGKYGTARPLFEKALEIRRRLLGDEHPTTAQSYCNLASNLKAQGQYAAAEPLYRKALEIDRRLLGDDHPDTARTYNNLALNLHLQGKYAAAQPLFEKALAIRRRLLGDDHPDTLGSYNNVASNLSSQGEFAAAEVLYEKVLSIRQRLLGDDHLDTAVSYNGLAANLNAQGKHAAAQPLHEKALAIRRRLLTDDHPDTASSYHNLAFSLDALGKYGTAQPLYEKALALRRRLLSDDHPTTAQSYSSLASNLNAQGQYAAAQPLYQKALEIDCRLLGDDHPDTARSHNNVAFNLAHQGKYAAAQPLFEKALALRRRLLGDEHPDTLGSYNNVASNLNSQGKFAAAEPLYEKVLSIRRRLLNDDHPDTALSYSGLASNLNSQGKFAAAEPLFETALAIRRRLLTDDHPDTARSYNNLAHCLWCQGKYAAAQPLFEQALAINRRLLTDAHPAIVTSHHNLASNLYAQGKYRDAVDQLACAARAQERSRLDAAFAGLDRATIMLQTGASPWFPALLARLERGTEAWQRLEEQWGRGLLDELAARQDQRLTPVERDRLRQLVTELERLDRLFETPMANSDQAERRKRLDGLRHDRDRVQIALGETEAELVQKYGPLAGEVAPLAKIQSSLPGDAALIAWVDVMPPGPNSADPDGEHWGVVVRAQGEPLWVKLPGTGKDQHWTPEDDALPGRVRAAFRDQPGPGSADWRLLAERLSAQRLAPLAAALAATPDGLPTTRRLIILPSAGLAAIPAEALLRPGDPWTVSYAPSATILTYLRQQPRAEPGAGLLALGDPLFEEPPGAPTEPGPLPDHGLMLTVVLPGSNAAKHGLKRGDVLLEYNGTPLRRKADLKVVPGPGEPVPIEVWREGRTARRALARGSLGAGIDPQPASVALEAQRRFDRLLLAARAGDDPTFARLPGTRFEVAELARLFENAKRPVRVLLDADASEPELDRLASSGALGHFGFIHLATHGVIDERFPQRSAIILTQTGLPDPLEQALHHEPAYDGRLVVREIQHGWDLKAELVTLSACETARGQYAGGEGFVGFTQALLISGAQSVCLSLWKVDDTATALLMRRFYASLLGGDHGQRLPKAEALAEAKAWLRSLRRGEVEALVADLSAGDARGKGAALRRPAVPQAAAEDCPYAHPHYWAAFVLIGDPD